MEHFNRRTRLANLLKVSVRPARDIAGSRRLFWQTQIGSTLLGNVRETLPAILPPSRRPARTTPDQEVCSGKHQIVSILPGNVREAPATLPKVRATSTDNARPGPLYSQMAGRQRYSPQCTKDPRHSSPSVRPARTTPGQDRCIRKWQVVSAIPRNVRKTPATLPPVRAPSTGCRPTKTFAVANVRSSAHCPAMCERPFGAGGRFANASHRNSRQKTGSP